MPGFDTTVTVGAVAGPLEGAARPGHFAGVATVVAILFSLVGAQRAYFGQKDAQQVMVIRRMALDLAIGTEVVACPTVREPDGLALSSRNVHLSPEERTAAAVLHRALARRARAVGPPANDRATRCGARCGPPSTRSRSPRPTTCRSPMPSRSRSSTGSTDQPSCRSQSASERRDSSTMSCLADAR